VHQRTSAPDKDGKGINDFGGSSGWLSARKALAIGNKQNAPEQGRFAYGD
jgi:hypothetical protein